MWLVIRVVDEHLDTSVFHARRRTGGGGAPGAAGYDPGPAAGALVWAYANKVTSSRRIETRCWSDVALRVICAGDVPDHVTIARFHKDFPGAVETLFTEVLVLCARLGMVTLGVVALDGTKLAASASKAANRTEERLRKMAADLVAEHARTDAAEDGLFGDARGDEVPPQATEPRDRAARPGPADPGSAGRTGGRARSGAGGTGRQGPPVPGAPAGR